MAERRMFAKKIIDSDAFLEMPLSSQALYFHLSMRADDEGFINNPKRIQRMINCSDDDMKLLIAKAFIIPFESGIVVIKHWKINNYLRNDRFKPTDYIEEKSHLFLKENGAYTLDETQGTPLGIPMVDQWYPQDRLGKDSIGYIKEKQEKEKSGASPQDCVKSFKKPTLEEVQAYCKERQNTVDAQQFIDFYESKGWYIGKNKMKDWKAAVRTWEQKRQPQRDYDERRYNVEDYSAVVTNIDDIGEI